jgi:hypothetical protein
VRYDDLIDEVIDKLSNVIDKPKDKIKLYRNGKELIENEMVADLEIEPDSELYFLVEDGKMEDTKVDKKEE